MGRRLKDVADVRFSNVDKISRAGERPVRLCNYTDVYNNDYITAGMEFMEATATHSEIAKFGLRVGDVLLTKDSETPNDIGIPTVVDEAADDLVCGYHLALIRPNHERVDPTYLSKQLAHHRIAGYFGQQANGSTRYGLSTASIEQAPLDLPRIEDQVAIGRILRLIDEAIQKTEAVIAKLKQIRAGMLYDLLTYGLDKDGKLRDPVAHPEQFKDSELGRIPREWEVVQLDDLGRWAGGKTPSKSDPMFWESGTALWVTPKDVKQRTVNDTEDKLTDLGASTMELFPAGSLVVVGRSGILRHTLPVAICGRPFTVNQDLKAFVPQSGDENTVAFLLLVLEQRDEEIRQRTVKTGTTVESIEWSAFKRVFAAWPKQEERMAIVRKTESLDETIGLYDAESGKLRQLKSGLMDDLLGGHVPVPENIGVNEA